MYLFLVTEGQIRGRFGGSDALSRFGAAGVWCGWVVECPLLLLPRCVEDVCVILPTTVGQVTEPPKREGSLICGDSRTFLLRRRIEVDGRWGGGLGSGRCRSR